MVASKFSEPSIASDGTPPFVAVEKSGVMVHERMNSSERATLIGLVQVTQRTAESTLLRYLKSAEVADVLTKGSHGCQEGVAEKQLSVRP